MPHLGESSSAASTSSSGSCSYSVGCTTDSIEPKTLPCSEDTEDKDLEDDTPLVSVIIIPQKKGLFIKHSEYEITTKQFGVTVLRRYKDFVAVHAHLIEKYPYRMIPNLPPKQIMRDRLLEERRRGLQNWLSVVTLHPVIGPSPILTTFITDKSQEYQFRMCVVYEKQIDEFNRLRAEVDLPMEDEGKIAVSREKMKTVLQALYRLKKLFEQQAQRAQNHAKDMADISAVYHLLHSKEVLGTEAYNEMALGAQNAAALAEKYAESQYTALTAKFDLLVNVLMAHNDLCDRVEKGVIAEYQKSLSKMVNINKQKIKSVIRGTGADNVNDLQQQEIAQNTEVDVLTRHAAFSLHCVLAETTLVETYLESLPSILLSFAKEESGCNAQTAGIWQNILVNGESSVSN